MAGWQRRALVRRVRTSGARQLNSVSNAQACSRRGVSGGASGARERLVGILAQVGEEVRVGTQSCASNGIVTAQIAICGLSMRYLLPCAAARRLARLGAAARALRCAKKLPFHLFFHPLAHIDHILSPLLVLPTTNTFAGLVRWDSRITPRTWIQHAHTHPHCHTLLAQAQPRRA